VFFNLYRVNKKGALKMGLIHTSNVKSKMWFGFDSSYPELFGGYNNRLVEYFFDDDHMEEVEEELDHCRTYLGENKERLDKFFNKFESYNSEEITDFFKNEFDIIFNENLIEWYEKLLLGEKIYQCLKENGECHFFTDI
jgi:hypothetical protein